MQASPTIGALATALAEAQKNFAPIPKDREVIVRMKSGGTYKFKYATLDAIRSATMPALAAQCLAVTQGLSDDLRGLETILYHGGSGEWLKNVTPMVIDGERSNQGMGSAQSYARRYGLSAILCVTADEDDDANAADGNHAEQVTSASSGGELRSAGRRPYSTPQATAEAQRDGLTDGAAPKPAAGPASPRTNGKKALTPEERAAKAKTWVDNAIQTIKLSGQTVDSLSHFRSSSTEAIAWVKDNFPKDYDRFEIAYEEVADSARALVAT